MFSLYDSIPCLRVVYVLFLIGAVTLDIHAKLHFDAVIITKQCEESVSICYYLTFCPVPDIRATQLEAHQEKHLLVQVVQKV